MLLKTSLLFIALSLASCVKVSTLTNFSSGFNSDPDAQITKRVVSIPAANSLKAEMGLPVQYISASNNQVEISAPSDLQDKIKIISNEGQLTLKLTETVSEGLNRVSIKVYTPQISTFKASSSARITLPANYTLSSQSLALTSSSGASINSSGGISVSNASLTSSSGSSISIALSATSVNCDSSSGSSITLSGTADNLLLTSSSGSSISAGGMNAKNGCASASSGSSITCNIANLQSSNSTSGASITNR
ncbi:MAG: DUF2807 domain-containing protein [Firmicutes bacterium]|nr:DUF2807 domain-containing protein [Bacillota bacterium]MCM1401161.1 DUF2807 domain-containing protein [Bacteroides sp.]MCM1477016.1 DUF2807 domain-containing protein [Bacteroides sp.]